MSKRNKKPRTIHMSVRLPPNIAEAVSAIAKNTGWSESKALTWMATAGDRVMKEPALKREQLLAELHAWSDKHDADLKAQHIMKEASAAVRSILKGTPPAKASSTLKAALKKAKDAHAA